MDWAMKYLQLRYRERRIGSLKAVKVGISVALYVKDVTGIADPSFLLHSPPFFDTCTQNWYAVENLLQNIKKDLQVTEVFWRSDEAVCYHNKQPQLPIVGNHFSGPQNGKDVRDRILCPMKLAIRSYCNKGHDILTARNMRKAPVEKRVEGSTASVNTINETNKSLKMKDIPNISTYHNFNYEKNGVRKEQII